MKTIRIGFVDFWEGFDARENLFTEILRRRFHVQIVDVDSEIKSEDNPIQYLFYSCFGQRHLEFDCVRIFYTGENRCPDFNICDYAIGFDLMTYGDRYIRYPFYMQYIGMDDFNKAKEKHLKVEDTDPSRSFCCMVVSNKEYADPNRRRIFEELSAYKRVESGGRYLNNTGETGGVKDKCEFQNNFKFSLALENSSHEGYVTEKLLQGFSARTVPIYWGSPTKDPAFNPNAYIDARDYESMDELIKAVKRIDQDDEAYLSMLRAPALNEPVIQKQQREFEEWLLRIPESDYEAAFRRCRYGNAKVYEEQQKQLFKLNDDHQREIRERKEPFLVTLQAYAKEGIRILKKLRK